MNLKRAPFKCPGRVGNYILRIPLYPGRKASWTEISLRMNSTKINEVIILTVCSVPNIMEITL